MPLLNFHCSVSCTLFPLFSFHYSVSTSQFPLLSSHYSIPTTQFPLLNSHYSVPTTQFHYLVITSCLSLLANQCFSTIICLVASPEQYFTYSTKSFTELNSFLLVTL